jgi:2-octaprenyl-6-methoxyphenol hydroxylase
MIPDHVDIAVVGGGPVGSTLALSLKDSGLSVLVLESQEKSVSENDPRTLALSYGSKVLLERLGVWQKLTGPTPIETIHISQRGGFGRAVLSAREAGVPALGYVVNYGALFTALRGAIATSGVNLVTGASVESITGTTSYGVAEFTHGGRQHAITAKLLVIADGGRSVGMVKDVSREVREYGQTAVVCQVMTSQPHHNIAYERFTPTGPAALLPSGEGYALVWTTQPDTAREICDLDDKTFLDHLQKHFGHRAGTFISAGKRSSFPLSLQYAKPTTSQRTVLIGNAAQMLHPVAGQGFNMGLRDAWELAQVILSTPKETVGDAPMLERYRRSRKADTLGGVMFTDFLVRGFSNDIPPLQRGRGLALAALDILPPLKNFVARKMIYGARG